MKEGIVSAATADRRDCKRDQCILLKPEWEKVKVGMAGIIGTIGAFDELVEPWAEYTECFGYFVAANSIGEEKTVPTFLSVMGAKTLNLLRSLMQPDKPGTKRMM